MSKKQNSRIRALTLLAACLITALPAAPPMLAQAAAIEASEPLPLKGVVFLSSLSQLQNSGISTPGVDTSHVKMLGGGAFREQITGLLGKPVTPANLQQIAHMVAEFYRLHNHPLVNATAPPQNVQSGVVQILVTEYRVGEVRAEGNNWFSDNVVTAPVNLRHGDTVDSEALLGQMDAANANPFRHVNLIYQPGAEDGYTDLVLQTQDRFPLRAFATFDNNGTPVTGRSRWGLGVTWGNALWHDQQLTYQFSASDNFFTGNSPTLGQRSGASFLGHSLTWSMPVFGRDSISVTGAYYRAIPNIGQDFGLVGVSGQAGIRFNLALPRTKSLTESALIGYDFKTTNNNLQFGGTQISRNNVEIDEFPLGYAANLTDRWGSSALTTVVYFSPGTLTPDNTNAAFQPAPGQIGRNFVGARYIYWRSDFTRLTKLPMDAVWSSRFVGQTSTTNLFYTEQLAAGGQELLRGYDPNSILGDKGVVLSNELRTPELFKKTEKNFGQLQFLTFWDWAHMSSVRNIDGAVNHLNASSVGLGCRYGFRANMSANFDYGWQLQHLPNTNDRDHLASVALMIAY